jgi:hypothetical protein
MTKHLIAARLMYVSLWNDGTVKTLGKTRSKDEKLCVIAPCTQPEGQALISLINSDHESRVKRLADVIAQHESENAGRGDYHAGLAAAVLASFGLDAKRERLSINAARRRERS